MRNVMDLDLDYLCLGCGGCEAICPVDAVKIELRNNVYLPQINEKKCIACNKCLDGCPGLARVEEGKEVLSAELFSEQKSVKEDLVLGKYLSNYLAYSADDNLRYSAASGGLATSILIYLFEENIIDGAVVTKMDSKDQDKSKTFIAQSPEEIMSAKTSKYCPTHPLSVLKELKKFEDDKSFAFVGLPCHIAGLRRLQAQEKWLKDKIIFSIGLLCTHAVDYSGTEMILNKLASGKKNLKEIKYRGDGWPGSAEVKYRDQKIKIPLSDYWDPYFGPYFFTPYRCLSCSDLVGELADISLGDAWLKDVEENDHLGTSIVITRSKFAEEILKKMTDDNRILIKEVSKNRIKESQENIIMRKKHTIAYRLNLFKLLSRAIPESENEFRQVDDLFFQKIRGYLGAVLIWFNAYLSKKSFGFQLIKFIPAKILKKYSYLVNKIASGKK